MKKYHLFSFQRYAMQGAEDYIDSFETLDEAKAYFMDKLPVYLDAAYIMETQPDGSLKSVASYWHSETGWKE